MPEHKVGTRQEWEVARDELLTKEKELTRRNDELSQERRELPWVPVDKDYSFDTEDYAGARLVLRPCRRRRSPPR